MSKYSPEIAKEIIQLIKACNYAKIAYGAVGISHETFREWKKGKEPFCKFCKSIKKAKAGIKPFLNFREFIKILNQNSSLTNKKRKQEDE